MLTRASFLPDMVTPSKTDIISSTIEAQDRSAYPSSRSWMKKAFSASRVASDHRMMPCRSQTSRTARRLAIDTGWPPAMLTVTATLT